MANVRLFGLVLIITAMFLGLAAVATQTTHIRFGQHDQWGLGPSRSPQREGPEELAFEPPRALPLDPRDQPVDALPSPEALRDSPPPVDFVSVPVVVPLGSAGLVGLVLWFLPTAVIPNRSPRRRSTGRRRRRRRSILRI